MCLATLYSLVQLIVKSYSYVHSDVFYKSETARAIYIYALSIKLVFETIIAVLFIFQMRQLYLIKSRTSDFSLK